MVTKPFTADSPYVCGWDTDSCCDALNNASEDLAQRCINSAAEILYALSGRQYGLCEVTVRPCSKPCAEGISFPSGGPAFPWVPVLSGGVWTNLSCGCRTACSCTTVCEALLPGPVDSVSEVKLNGVVLTEEEDYRVDNRRSLVRLGGECWPKCQDMNKPDTEDNTWSVTYLKGLPLPEAGRSALSEFACELCLGCTGDNKCRLPSRVTSIQRLGVTMALLDPMTFIDYGRTGLYSVDLWLKTVNPLARSRGAAVMSPDVEIVRRQTWP